GPDYHLVRWDGGRVRCRLGWNERTVEMTKTLPRGVRNSNPGNLEWGDPWQGLVPVEQRTDSRFCQFVTPAYGIRALALTLITYYDRHRISTVEDAISRWAPPVENDTLAYQNAVARAV